MTCQSLANKSSHACELIGDFRDAHADTKVQWCVLISLPFQNCQSYRKCCCTSRNANKALTYLHLQRKVQESFYLYVWSVDVACVIFFGRHQLYSVLFIRNNLPDAVALSVFRQGSSGEDPVCLFLWNLLIFCKHHPLFQLPLQDFALRFNKKEHRSINSSWKNVYD